MALREAATSVNDARDILANLPCGLDDTYEHALLSTSNRTATRRALAWLMAVDKITLSQLSDAVRINPKASPVYESSSGHLNNEVFRLLPRSLITLSDTPIIPGEEHRVTVSLSHFSVQEYLSSSRIKDGPAADFAFDLRDARALVTESALAYHFHVAEDPKDSGERCWYPSEVPKELWRVVGRLGLSTADDLLAAGDRSFVADIRSILTPSRLAYRCLAQSNRIGTANFVPTPLILSAHSGWYNITAFLLEDHSADMDEVGSFAIPSYKYGAGGTLWGLFGRSPNDIDIDRRTFEIGSDAELRGTALLAACYMGQPRIVELLMERGANPYAGHPGIPCALAVAVDFNFSDVATVSTVLLKDPEVTTRCRAIQYWPLHSLFRLNAMAIRSVPQKEKLRSLVARGFRINDLDQFGFTPLYWLARLPFDLRRQRGDGPITKRDFGDASKLMVRRYFRQMLFHVKHLKEIGADMNAPCSEFGSALQCAAARDNDLVLEALVRRGARLDPAAKAWDAFLAHLTAHRPTEAARFWHGDEGGCLLRLWALQEAFGGAAGTGPAGVHEQRDDAGAGAGADDDDLSAIAFSDRPLGSWQMLPRVEYWMELKRFAWICCDERRRDGDGWVAPAGFPEPDSGALLALVESVNAIMAGFAIPPTHVNHVDGMGQPLHWVVV